MEFAIDADGNRIDAWDYDGQGLKGKLFCPTCGEEVFIRKGEINASHFAHRAGECTDHWHYDMSEWHQKMQGYFSPEYREVVCVSNGERHRADILKDGVVVEFQHSPIPKEEYVARNRFYQSLGYKVIWVFDVSEERENRNLYFSNDDKQFLMRWKYPKRILQYSPKISDNSGTFALFLWFGEDGDEFVEKVIWNAPDFTRIMISEIGYSLAKDMDPNELLVSKAGLAEEGLQERLQEVKPYSIKYSGVKGHSRQEYLCPITGEWLQVYKKCQYCPHCGATYKWYNKQTGKTAFNIYCCYPRQVNDKVEDGHPGYDYYAPMF